MESKEEIINQQPQNEVENNPQDSTSKDDVSEENSGAASSSSWWGGYSNWMDKAVNSVSSASVLGAEALTSVVETAKQKSTEVYGLVSKDLEEVTTHANSMVRSSSMTIKKTFELDWFYTCDPNLAICSDDLLYIPEETTKIDEKSDELADQAFDSVKTGVNSAWKFAAGYTSQMFKEEDLEAEALLVREGEQEPVELTRLQAQLYALAADQDTFLAEPHADDLAEYEAWKCDLDKRQGEISELMISNANIRKHFSTLVPEKVTHKLFWTRYFFKVHLIELQENRRQILKKRAAEVASKNENEENNWDDVADLADNPTSNTIPAEVQEKLLSEYEKELIESKVNKVQKDLKKELNLKDKQTTPDKEETSSDDWEKLSSGSKSPRKQSKEGEDEDWVQT